MVSSAIQSKNIDIRRNQLVPATDFPQENSNDDKRREFVSLSKENMDDSPSEMTSQNLAPIWFPHWPARRCTISLIVIAVVLSMCQVKGNGKWSKWMVMSWEKV